MVEREERKIATLEHTCTCKPVPVSQIMVCNVVLGFSVQFEASVAIIETTANNNNGLLF